MTSHYPPLLPVIFVCLQERIPTLKVYSHCKKLEKSTRVQREKFLLPDIPSIQKLPLLTF